MEKTASTPDRKPLTAASRLLRGSPSRVPCSCVLVQHRYQLATIVLDLTVAAARDQVAAAYTLAA